MCIDIIGQHVVERLGAAGLRSVPITVGCDQHEGLPSEEEIHL